VLRIFVAEGSFHSGQTAKARSGHRVQSLPFGTRPRDAFFLFLPVMRMGGRQKKSQNIILFCAVSSLLLPRRGEAPADPLCELLLAMHDAEPRGHACVNSNAPAPPDDRERQCRGFPAAAPRASHGSDSWKPSLSTAPSTNPAWLGGE